MECPKERERDRKARSRRKKVLCGCTICNGQTEQRRDVAEKHLRTFGPQPRDERPKDDERDESTSSPDNFASEPLNQADSSAVSDSADDTEEVVKEIEKEPSENCEIHFATKEHALYNTERAKAALYPGSATTVLETLCRYFCWFSEHPGVSKSSLSSLLSIQHEHVLPPNNSLPPSYEEAYKFIEPFLLPLETFNVCPKHCVIYRDCSRYKFATLTECPVCGTPRYIGTSKKPMQRFHYYPVGPRWRRMYGEASISEILQNHGRSGELMSSDDGVMRDIHDAPQFSDAYGIKGAFKGDPRGMSLQFSTDGMNPFSHGTYSMWPLTLTMLNLPKSVRHLLSNIMLVGIIPGSSAGNLKLDAYLEVLVD